MNNLLRNLSPSTVNSFLDYRTMWFYTKILKRKLPDSCDMARGNAVEAAINAFFQKGGDATKVDDQQLVGECIDWALKTFDEVTATITSEEKDEYRASIKGLAVLGIRTVSSYGVPLAIQRKTNCFIQGVSLPWLGFIDYIFPGEGENKVKVVDLKVTGKTPSKLSPAHSRQGSFYEYALGVDNYSVEAVDFVYLIPLKEENKTVTFTLENSKNHMRHLVAGASAIEKLIARYSIDDLKEMFLPSPADFWLTDSEGNYHPELALEFEQYGVNGA